MRTGPSLQRKWSWKGIATPSSTEPQAFAFVKIDLGSCYSFVLGNHLLQSLYIQTAEYEDNDIISKRGNTCCKRALKRDTAQGRICPLIPKSTEHGFQSEDIEKRRQWTGGRADHSIANAPKRLPFTCTTAWSKLYIKLIHLWTPVNAPLTCIYGGGWVHYVGSTTIIKEYLTLPKIQDYCLTIKCS